MTTYPIGNPIGYQQVANTGTAGGLTVPTGCSGALIAVSGNAVRVRFDGTAPTASVGFPIAAGDTLQLSGNVRTLQLISQTGTATVDVLFY